MRISTFFLILVLLTGCLNPKSDAQKVCDCLAKIDWNEANSESYKKYINMDAGMTTKYEGKPEKYLEYQRELDSCTEKEISKRERKKK